MTFRSSFTLQPRWLGRATTLMQAHPHNVSVVIPVKNNQRGVDRFLTALMRTHTTDQFPGEIILVDNNSSPPLHIAPHYAERGLTIVTFPCTRPGPASARNAGAQAAHGAWILFTDSDCIPTETFLEGYLSHLTGAVGYAGSVLAAGSDKLSHYYESQAILIPPPVQQGKSERPAYVITANALVWKQAWLRVGGFNETIQIAAGEDINFGLRLWEIGPLSYAPYAQVMHAFEGGLSPFVKRFVRYGRSNRFLRHLYHIDLAPRPFVANVPSFPNRLLASLQYVSLWWGYHTTLTTLRTWAMREHRSSETTIPIVPMSALFLDGDQVSPHVVGPILAEMARRGWTPSIRHVYRKPRPFGTKKLDTWENIAQQYELDSLEVDLQKPNAVDMALALGAMNVLSLVSPHFVCIATSDTDFLLLVQQLHQAGCYVLGIGATHTSQRLRVAYDAFVTYDQLPPPSAS